MTTLDERKTDVGDVVQLDDHRQGNWFDKLCPPPPPPPRLTMRVKYGPPVNDVELLADDQLVCAGHVDVVIRRMAEEFGQPRSAVWYLEVPARGKVYTLRRRTRAELDAGVTAIVDEQPLEATA